LYVGGRGQYIDLAQINKTKFERRISSDRVVGREAEMAEKITPAGAAFVRARRNKFIRSRRNATALIAAAAMLAGFESAKASVLTWDVNGTSPGAPQDGAGTWDTATPIWSNGSSDNIWNNANNDTAVFGAANGAAGVVAVTAGGVTVGGITFDAAGSGTYNVGSSGGAITFGALTDAITMNANGTLSTVLAGSGQVTIGGSGILAILNGANTYVGGTTLSSTTVNIGTGQNQAIATPFGASGNNLVLSSSTINGTGSGSGGSISYATPYNVTVTGTDTINTGKNFTFEATGFSTSGTGKLVFNDNGSNGNFTSNLKGAFGSNFTGTLETTAVTTGANIRAFANGGSFLGVPSGVLDMEGSVPYTMTPQTNSGGNTFTYGALEGASTTAVLAGGTAGAPTDTVGGLGLSTTFAGGIQGNTIFKLTGGSLTLPNPGSNTFTGATSITGGTLYNNGGLPSTLVTISGGATLGGNGTFGQLVTNNGLIAPGATSGTIGTMALNGGLTFGSNASYNDDINSAGLSDLLSTTNLTLASGDILNVNVLDSTSGGTYTIASYSGALSGTFATTNLPNGYAINYGTGSDSTITLSVAAVPEPVTGILWLGGLGGTMLRRRRRKDKI
jgi:hypothetical protein